MLSELEEIINCGRPDWHEDAKCRGMAAVADEDGDSMFFPGRGETTDPLKALCNQCPVTVECLAMALQTNAYGVWGGTSERERRRMSQKERDRIIQAAQSQDDRRRLEVSAALRFNRQQNALLEQDRIVLRSVGARPGVLGVREVAGMLQWTSSRASKHLAKMERQALIAWKDGRLIPTGLGDSLVRS